MAIEARTTQEQLDELARMEKSCWCQTHIDHSYEYGGEVHVKCKGTGRIAAHEWARMECPLSHWTYLSGQYRHGVKDCPGYRPRTPDEVSLEDVLVTEGLGVKPNTIVNSKVINWLGGVQFSKYNRVEATPTLAAISAAHAAWKEGQNED